MQNETGAPRDFANQEQVQEIVTRCTDGLHAACSEEGPCPGNSSGTWGYLAGMLIRAGDYERVRMIFSEHDETEMGSTPLVWWGMKLSYARGLAFAMTGLAQENVSIFEDFLNEPLADDVESDLFEAMRDLLADSREQDQQPPSQPYYNDIEAVIGQLEAYHAGGWVDLEFDEALTGWFPLAAEKSLSEEGELTLSSTASHPGIQIFPIAHFAPPFVCEAEMKLGDPQTRSDSWPGLHYGTADSRALYAKAQRRMILLSPHEHFAATHDASKSARFGKGVYMKPGDWHLLRFKVFEGHIDFSVDHEDIRSEKNDELLITDRFIIGEQLPSSKPTNFHVRRVRIRKLTHGPPPLSVEETDQWIDFNLAERENDPLDPNAWSNLGWGYHTRGDYEQAVECFEKVVELNPRLINPHYSLGEAQLALGRYAAAIDSFRRAIEKNGKHTSALSQLAWIRAACPVDGLRDAEEALLLAERANQVSSEDHWMPLYALAAAQAEQGDFDAAEGAITRSYDAAPVEKRAWVETLRQTIEEGRPLRIEEQSPSTN